MKKKWFITLLLPFFLLSCKTNGGETSISDTSEEEIVEHPISEYLLSEKINLINLKGETTFDLNKGDKFISLYLEEAKGPLSYSLVSMVTGEETPLTDNTVNFNNIQKAYYVVVIYHTINNKKYPLYAYYADFYDENDPFIWNDYKYSEDDIDQIMIKGDARGDDLDFAADENDYYRATNANPQASYVTAGKGPDGEDGNYYRIHSDEAGYLGYAEGLLINFAPLHSSKYYRLFDDNEYLISYDLYISGSGGIDQKTGALVPDDQIYCVFATISEQPSYAEFEQPYNRFQYYGVNGWKRVTVPLKDYFGSNPHLEDIKNDHPNTLTGWKWMVDKESIWGSDYPKTGSLSNMTTTDVYIGNFSITRTKFVTEDLGLIDKKETSSLDLTNYQEDKFSLYRLKGNEEVFIKDFTNPSLSLDDLEGQYVIYVIDNDALASKIYFDAYHSDHDVIWGDDPNGCITTLWGQYEDYETSTMGLDVIDNSEVPLLNDKTGTYYKLSYYTTAFFRSINFIPSPLHSEAYYEKYHSVLDEYGISFDVLIDDNNGALPWVNGSIKHDYNSSSHDYSQIVNNLYDSGTYPIKYIHAEYTANQIYSYTLSLDVLYECWNSYNDAIKNTLNTNNVVAGSSLTAIATNRLGEQQGQLLQYYVGNIQPFKYDAETKLSYSNIVIDNIPENASVRDDMTSIDVKDYLGDKNLNLYNKYSNSTNVSLTLSQDGVVKYTSNSSVISVADNIDVGTYQVNLSMNEYQILGGNLYVYHYDADLEGLDINSDISTNTNMVDTQTTSTYSLLNLNNLSSGNISAMNLKPELITYTLFNEFSTPVSGSGLSIAISDVENVSYNIEVKIKDFKLYIGSIDFYDLSNINSNDWLNPDNLYIYKSGNDLKYEDVTYIPWHGINGNYTKIANPGISSSDIFVITIKPTHSKEYYQFTEVNNYFTNKELTYSVKGYVNENGTYYGSDSGYNLRNVLAARNDQPWLMASDGANLSPGTVPVNVPDGTHGHLYFSTFLLMYDNYVLGNNASYSIFGVTGSGLLLEQSGTLVNKEFSIYIGNFNIGAR